MPVISSRQAHEYRLHLNGTWGHKRKPQFATLAMTTAPERLSDVALEALASAVLARAKPKPGCKWQVFRTPATIEQYSDGTEAMLVEITAGECVLRGEVS